MVKIREQGASFLGFTTFVNTQNSLENWWLKRFALPYPKLQLRLEGT
jgi:hypothetical protein